MRVPHGLAVGFGLLLSSALIAPPAGAQEGHGAPVRYIISIGHYPRVDGIRLNYRDHDLDLVRGVNATMWVPYDDDFQGTVRGIALGLPATGAENIHGIGFGIFGLGASNEIRGLSFGGLGVGAGGSVHGAAVGGLGVGTGGQVRGLAAGGLGVGAGGSARGILVGGLGAGVGGDLRGAAVGGLGVGAGGSVRGLLVGGLGVGAGGSVRGVTVGGVGVGAGGGVRGISVGGVGVASGGTVSGIQVAGVGVGAGGRVSGVTVAGVGVGAGGTVWGLTVAGLGIGAPRLEGGMAALLVGAETTKGVVIAPILFRTEIGGSITGASVSSVNAVRGSQVGLTVGIVNYAERLKGVQLGVINIVRDNPAPFKALPLINFGTGK